MQILLSTTNTFAKWLKLELPRIPSPDGKRIGTQPLESGEQTLAWQCHVVRQHSRARKGIVIAVETRSRYTLLMSFNSPPSTAEFENELRRCWGNAFLHFGLECGAFPEDAIPELLHRFAAEPVEFLWYRNTDLSVNGHVADAEQWIKQYLDDYGIDHLTENDAQRLELHINDIPRRVKVDGKRSEPFIPVIRMVDDGLYRFARGVVMQDYPSPYYPALSSQNVEAPRPGGDNVVSMADFVRKKGTLDD
jgi:hypothetical protein